MSISSFAVSLALACGAPLAPDTPGAAGTAIFENDYLVSVFSGRVSPYDGRPSETVWERLDLRNDTMEYITTIPGALQANIETDAKTETAISAQDGVIVQIDSGKTTPIAPNDHDAATTVFGATLGEGVQWLVLAQQPATDKIALYRENDRGSFEKIASTSAPCKASMLTLVKEASGRLVGVCGDLALVFQGGALHTVRLPMATALRLDDQGRAVFTGLTKASEGSTIERLRLSGTLEVSVEASVTLDGVQAAYALPVDDNAMIAVAMDGRVQFATRNGTTWSAGPGATLASDRPFLSARGAPLRVLSGAYTLELATLTNDAVSTRALGAIGEMPATHRRRGCAQANAGNALAVVLATLALALRAKRRRSSKT
ncbi:MAG: hypothetical protein IT381_23800 [Deltaproteobacteria bacterium]|nr:hypothetical protein [Deltaproteobacteria bacterium]